MSAPVTHDQLLPELAPIRERLDRTATKAELQAELAPIRERLDRTATKDGLAAAVAPLATKDELAAAVAPLATKDELAAAVAPLATKDELAAAVAPLATKDELAAAVGALRADNLAIVREVRALAVEMRGMRIELSTDLARHVSAMTEDLCGEARAVDEKYADLPDRVAALERDR